MLVKVGVVGSRRRNSRDDFYMVRNSMKEVVEEYGKENVTFVSGGCPKGADNFAEQISEQLGTKIIIHKPDKTTLDKELMKHNPKAAYAIINFARNTLIAEDSDILIACVAPDRKGGTEDTISKYVKINDKEGSVNLILC